MSENHRDRLYDSTWSVITSAKYRNLRGHTVNNQT